MIRVFYDGKCGLCYREINHYRRIAPAGVFDWQDITDESANTLRRGGISLSAGLKQLHVKDNDGRLHVGIDAFILMWRQLKHWRWLARLVSLPVIRQAAGV